MKGTLRDASHRLTLTLGVAAAIAGAGCTDRAPLAPEQPSASAAVQASNLVNNPGFEGGTTGWQDASKGGRAVVTTQAHSGVRSLQITVSSKHPRAVHQDLAVTAGAPHDAAGWIRTTGVGGAGARIELIWLNASGLPAPPPSQSIIARDVLGTLTGTQAWTRVGQSVVAPAGSVVARLNVLTEIDPDNSGTAWFDDTELIPTSPDALPPVVSITAPAAGSTVAGVITVAADATDDVAVAGVQFQVDGANTGAEDTSPPYELSYGTATLPDGDHTFTAVARDAANNTTVSAGVTVTFANGTTSRPNIIVIMTDDQRADLMQYMPRTAARLASETVKFDRAFATTPLCCPSRVNFLTGRYSHNTGVLQNTLPNGGVTKFDPTSTIGTWLQKAGYRTGIYGKYLNGYDELLSPLVHPGWDEWHILVDETDFNPSVYYYYNYTINDNGVITPYGSAVQDYSMTVLTQKVVEFIASTPPSQPFFVYLTPYAPHDPSVPHPTDIGSYANHPDWRPPSFNEADVSDKPAWIRRLSPMTSNQIAVSDSFHRRQLEALQAVDRAIVEIVDSLEAAGRWSNTVLVVTSDNGYAWGEHRLRDRKACVYEECVRVPLWVRAPGLVSRTDASLVGLIDLAPSIAEWGGATPATSVNGRSLLPLLSNGGAPWRTELLLELLGSSSNSTTFSAVRTSQYVYVEYRNGDRELYDLQVDPYQLTNVVNDPAHAGTVSTLRNLLAALKVS